MQICNIAINKKIQRSGSITALGISLAQIAATSLRILLWGLNRGERCCSESTRPLELPFLPLVKTKILEMPHSVRASPQPGRLPYWQVNVPAEQRTKQCPEYLQEQSEKNQRILATRDEDYSRQTWPVVQDIVSQCTGLALGCAREANT